MSISGNLKTMALAELLQWLASGQKTGTLVIDKGDDKVEKRIFFDDGVIISSASTDPKEYLGRFLVSHGYLDEDEVDAAVARQNEEKKLLGQILVDMGHISEEDLEEMLRLKAEETIYDIFTWPQGAFEFLDGELPEKTMVKVKVDVQFIVLEGTRRQDEWNRIRETVPSPECVPVLVRDIEEMGDELELDEVDRRILEWVDDERSVDEISSGSMTSLFQVADIFAEQVKNGVLKMVKPRIIEVKVPVPAAEGEEGKIEAGQAKVPEDSGMYQLAMLQQMAQMNQMMGQYQNAMTPSQMQAQMQGQMPQGQGQGQPSGGQGIDVGGGQTLNFAGGGGGGAPSAAGGGGAGDAAPGGAAGGSAAEAKIQEAESALKDAKLQEALAAFRAAAEAEGADAGVESKVKEGEEKVLRALERAGVRMDAVPKLKCDMGELQNLDISAQEGFMLSRVDGSYDIQSILKMSPMPKIDAQLLFWRLRKSGHIGL